MTWAGRFALSAVWVVARGALASRQGARQPLGLDLALLYALLLPARRQECTTLGPLMRNPRYGDGGADDEEAAKAVIASEKATTAIATSRRSRWLALAAIATAAAVAAAVLVRRRRA